MDAHLSGTKPTETPSDEEDAIPSAPTPNKRNGFSQKTLKTEFGPLRLDIPRDRQNTFDPIVVPKHNRSFGKIDEQIIVMRFQCGPRRSWRIGLMHSWSNFS